MKLHNYDISGLYPSGVIALISNEGSSIHTDVETLRASRHESLAECCDIDDTSFRLGMGKRQEQWTRVEDVRDTG